MPCNSDYMMPTEHERNEAHHRELTKIKTELDRLTRENDLLREMVINLDQGGKLTATELAFVKHSQMVHRKEDLARLEKKFRASIADQKAMGQKGATDSYVLLGLVVTADPTKPLEPQLGFDPDSV